jgi:hypothetical protein
VSLVGCRLSHPELVLLSHLRIPPSLWLAPLHITIWQGNFSPDRGGSTSALELYTRLLHRRLAPRRLWLPPIPLCQATGEPARAAPAVAAARVAGEAAGAAPTLAAPNHVVPGCRRDAWEGELLASQRTPRCRGCRQSRHAGSRRVGLSARCAGRGIPCQFFKVKLSVTCVIWTNSSHEFFLPQTHLLPQLR